MKLVTGRRCKTRAFTLLEIITVIALIALLTAGAARSMMDGGDSSRFEMAGTRLSSLARRAHREAAVSGVAHEIMFYPEGFSLRPADFKGDAEEGFVSHELDEGMGMELLSWGEKKWRAADGYRWVFPPYGLSEPLSVRFSRDDAGLEMSLDPLGGAIAKMRSI